MSRLSSEILEEQFGPTHVEVLRHDQANRIIRTLTNYDKQVLEVSWVTFNPIGVELFPDVHRAMGNGTSMGKAFERIGVDFARENERTRKMCLPFFNDHHFMNKGRATITEVSIAAGTEMSHFGTILEAYNPAVTWPRSCWRRPDRQQLLDKLRWFELIVKYSD